MRNRDRINESLSALSDGECDELEAARVLKALRGNAALRRRWERLHLMRAAMRGEALSRVGADFAERVGRRLDQEAHVLVPARPQALPRAAPPRWRRPLAGLAVAASVALVSVAALRALQPQDVGGSEPQLARSEVLPRPLAVPAAVIGGTRWNLERAELEQRLNHYLLNHMEYAAMGEMQGMLPYSRLAGYDRAPSQ